MPINVRNAGTWKATDRVYIMRGGRWTRAYAAYVWTDKGSNSVQSRWVPMWDYGLPANLPAPTSFRGIGQTHSTGHLAWDASSNPLVAGYRILQHNVGWYPPEGQAPMPRSQTDIDWGGLGLDSTYTWTIYSEDEYGTRGPGSPAISLSTGHPTSKVPGAGPVAGQPGTSSRATPSTPSAPS
jgi:hypothetical protein